MSWETVSSLPRSGTSGSPYQGHAEPVVAERVGLRAMERVRLFFRSTPELPSARAARTVVVTPTHVYVKRVSGTIQRVRLEQLQGRRVDGPLVVYGVIDGEDLALMPRARCPVTAALDAHFGDAGKSDLAPVVVWRHNAMGVGLASALALLGTFWLTEYSLDEMWERIHQGLYTAEVVMGVVAGAVAMLGALVVVEWVPVKIHIDTLGVRRVRGLIPWLHYLDPPEGFRAVWVESIVYRGRTSGKPGNATYEITLRRHGDRTKGSDLRVSKFSAYTEQDAETQRGQANELAQRIAKLLSLPVEPSR